MFFILSKILHFLLMPLTWSIGFFFGSLFSKNRKRKRHFLVDGMFILILFSNPLFMNMLIKWIEEEPKPFYNVSRHDVGIVLSGMANLDKEPKDRIYFNKGADRIYDALILYRKNKINKILITGGNIDLTKSDESEAQILKSFLLNARVPESDIIIEPHAQNTHQNATYTKEILESRNWMNKKLILITSAYHMNRARWCFEKEGMKVTTFPGDYYSSDEINWESFLPSQSALANSRIFFHEIFGIISYKLMGYI